MILSPQKSTSFRRTFDPVDMPQAQPLSAFVRVRPFTQRQIHHPVDSYEQGGGAAHHNIEHSAPISCIYRTSPSTLVVDQRTASVTDKQASRDLTFTFDKVFWSIPQEQKEYLHPADRHAADGAADQADVFESIGKPMADSTLQGYHSCVFAFGQTGSGKSYTMFGPPTPADQRGLAPRIATYLFQSLNEIQHKRNLSGAFHRLNSGNDSVGSSTSSSLGYSYSVAVSCFEIYNEKLYDLLSRAARSGGRSSAVHSRVNSLLQFPSDATSGDNDLDSDVDNDNGRATPGSHQHNMPGMTPSNQSEDDDGLAHNHAAGGQPTQANGGSLSSLASLKIRHHPVLGTYIEGLRVELVEDEESLIALIGQSLKHRVTASNHVHDASSRSHAIMTFTVTQEDTISGTRKVSTLNVVDLAGSERGARHGASGQQLHESKKINLSLTSLRRVIDMMVAGTSSMQSSMGRSGRRGTPQRQMSSSNLGSSTGAPPPSSPSASGHLPVRDSKLTEVMAECLGGNSRTFMIATVSPHDHNIMETLDSLRYCTKAKGIVNRLKPNEERIAVAVAAIQHEIERLQRELDWRNGNQQAASVESWLQKRGRILHALRTSNKERRAMCQAHREECSAISAALEAAHIELARLLPIQEESDAFESQRLTTTNRNLLQQRDWEAQRKHISVLRALHSEESQVVAELESTPLPPAIRELIRAKKRCWRVAFLIAASEFKVMQERKDLLSDIHALIRACHGVDEHRCVVDGVLDGSTAEATAYRRVVQRLKHSSIAVAMAYEAFYRSCVQLRSETQSIQREIDDVRGGDLRRAEEDVRLIDERYQPSLHQAGQLVYELQRQLDSETENVAAVEALGIHLTSEMDQMTLAIRQGTSELEQNSRTYRDQRAQAAVHQEQVGLLRVDVSDLEQDIRQLEIEAELLDNELVFLKAELSDNDKRAEVAVRHLVDAEHATRQLCVPDAVATIADAPLAAGILSVERAAWATPQCITGSIDRNWRSRSQDSRLPGSTPRPQKQGTFSRTPSRTPLTWKTAGTLTPQAYLRRPLDEPSPRPDPPVALYVEDF